MCDYSLTNVRSRPARVGDKLTVRDFGPEPADFAPRKTRASRCACYPEPNRRLPAR